MISTIPCSSFPLSNVTTLLILISNLRMGRFRRFAVRASGVCLLGGAAFDLTNDRVLTRSFRTLVAAGRISYSYKFTEPETLEQLQNLNQHAAQVLLDTCLINEGLYVKFAQGVSTMNHILPPEFGKTLAVCLDHAPQVSLEDVKRIIHEETGQSLDELFVEFDEQAVASASIAQVHRAKYREPTSGEILDVAVKVQKPKIRRQVWWDLTMHDFVCHALQRLFDIPCVWAAHTIKETMMREVDFKIEADNLELAAENFADREDVVIPKVVRSLLSQRLLVTEWMDATKLSDIREVSAKFKTSDVMRSVVEALAAMLFDHGLLHADPHPANVLVRPYQPKASRNDLSKSESKTTFVTSTPKPKHQIVLLDFGMCIKERDQFMDDYSRMFTSIFAHDFGELESIMKSWGIRHGDLFATMMIQKPIRRNVPMTSDKPLTKDDIRDIQRKMKEKSKDLMEDDKLVPRELVFVGRAMNIVRSVNKSYGAPVNRVNILAECAAAAQQRRGRRCSSSAPTGTDASTTTTQLSMWRRRWNTQVTRTSMSLLFFSTSVYAWVLSLFFGAPPLPISADPEVAAAEAEGGRSVRSMEDLLEMQEQEAFNQHLKKRHPHEFNIDVRD